MKLLLIIAGHYSSCLAAREIWQTQCAQAGIELEVADMDEPHARERIQQLDLKSFPALLADNHILAVGSPDQATAKRIIDNLLAAT